MAVADAAHGACRLPLATRRLSAPIGEKRTPSPCPPHSTQMTTKPTTTPDDDVPTRRESHFNNQRSSLVSEAPSAGPRPRPRSRTVSDLERLKDFDLSFEKATVGGGVGAAAGPDHTDSDALPSLSPVSTASPAPNIPYVRRREPSGSSVRRSFKNSSKRISRSTVGSRASEQKRTTEEALLAPESWLHLYKETAHSPNRPTSSLHSPRTRGQSRKGGGDSTAEYPNRPRSQSQGQSQPRRFSRKPVAVSAGSQLDITALPSMLAVKEEYNASSQYTRRSPQARKASRLATHLYTVSYLIFFSIWGTLARLGLQALTFYPGVPVTVSVLWANVAGTLIMGFLSEDRQLFAAEWGERGDPVPEPLDEPAARQADKGRHGKVKKTIPMYIGLATGFCGSFTSFSSFIRDVFLALANELKAPVSHAYPANAPIPAPTDLVPRNGGYSFLALCATIIVTIASCYCALHVGAHIASGLDRWTPTLPFRLTRRILDPVFVFLGCGTWLGAVILVAIPPHDAWRSQALFAIVFAPVGCLLRYYLSLLLNPINPTFPVGTFSVNILGTAVLGMTWDLQHVQLSTTGLVGGSVLGCQALQGIMDGFCGCLTTVSTWIVEIDSLKTRAAYVYASLSVVAGFSLLLVIMGSVRWTSGSTNWFRGHFHTIKCSSRSYRVDVYIAELAPTGEHGAKIPAPGTRNIFEQPADVHTKQADNVISTVVFIFETCYRMSNTPLAWSSKWCYGGYLKAHASADAHDRKLCSTLKLFSPFAMPAGTHTNPHTPRVRNGNPEPAPVATPEPASSKRDLTSWWRQFSKRPAKKDDDKDPVLPGIFGVPLIQSIPYANVAISLFNEHGESYIYGYVPIVVAKCGVFLKEKATDVEGIFRLAGSEKRIKELKLAFDTPPRYGKGLDWSGYTVHDAANILRRYFNNLPEPIIPLQHYHPFRNPLRGHQAEAVGPNEGQDPSVGGFDADAAVRVYQHQIKALPSLNRQLLLYILDLLAVFAAKADVNKMTTSNLAAIFQPGLLSHPEHDMSPKDYRLSQDVLIFLIDNQDHFLIGMEGTAVDEGTVKHIESGPPTPQARTPTTPRNSVGIGRSASTTSSAGAESLRMHGGVRRNVSTSSKRSRHSGAVPSPITPAFVSPTTSGVHRSNTLPSKRSPAIGSPRFPTSKQPGHSPPTVEEAKSPLPAPVPVDAPASMDDVKEEVQQPPPEPEVTQSATTAAEPTAAAQPVEPELQSPKRAQTLPPNKIEMPKPFAAAPIPETFGPFAAAHEQGPAITPALHDMPGAFPLHSPGVIPPSQPTTPNVTAQDAQSLLPPRSTTPGQDQHSLQRSPQRSPYRSPQRSPHHTPTRERSEFLEGPVDSGPSVEPTPAVRTFTQILSKVAASPTNDYKEGKESRKPNKLQKKRMPNSISQSTHSSTHSLGGSDAGFGMSQFPQSPPSPLHPPQPPFAHGQSQSNSSKEALQDTGSSRASGNTLKPSMSPSASFRSHSTATEWSETELAEDLPKEEKRSFWKGHRRGESKATPTASQTDLHGSVPGGDKSMSSFASSSGWTGGGGGRRSGQYESIQGSEASMVFGSPPDSDKHEKKGTFDWFHKRRQDHRERADRRERAKSPPGSSTYLPSPQNLMQSHENLAVRGRPSDMSHPTEGTQPKADKSSDVTPTGTSPTPPPQAPAKSSPTPRNGPMALRTDLPAALFEPRSVARSPDRNPLSPIAGKAPQFLPVATSPVANVESVPQSQPQPPTEAPAQPEALASAPQPAEPTSTPSAPLHASSDSTITVTPQTVNPETSSDAPPADQPPSPSQAPAPPAS
ncbi:rho-gtpase-activating protein 5 [Stemphylium lycopersici]|nr:rho-gtpase-activating protein 5 [Stemphylium lycopersici]RAR11693.1 rho-gtpase-activating protein 5 [Stemphylium lycopersici]